MLVVYRVGLYILLMFLCGYFNIDILKHDSHSGTKHFVDTMYSLNLYPLINTPTRVTRESATLIDNIFTNLLTNLKDNFFDTNVGSRPNLARMCG